MIEVRSLGKTFGGRRPADDLSVWVLPRRATALLRPNAAGKTTTPRILLGLVTADPGPATINGKRYVDLRSPLRSVGASLENSAFHPGRSGRNHLRFLAALAGISTARVDQVLDEVGLTD